ncbi:unnamed protein product, partial [marine sediment metagenome]
TKEKLEIGAVALDAIFTPVRRVSFRVENMRVGERTDFDRLFLEIETDGTITPEEAFSEASEVLLKHFSLFTDIFKTPAEKKVPKEKTPKKKSTPAKATAAKKAAAAKKKKPRKNSK